MTTGQHTREKEEKHLLQTAELQTSYYMRKIIPLLFFNINLFILFIFGGVGSSLLRLGFF